MKNIPFADVSELCTKLKTLVSDKDLREKFGRDAYKPLLSFGLPRLPLKNLLGRCKAIEHGEDY